MKLLYIIAQEDDGRYVSILLDQPARKKQPIVIENVDLGSGIITPISPEEEAEDERVANGVRTLEDRNLGKVLQKNNKKEEE